MALLDAVGSILATAGLGTTGTNIFLSRMQDSPDVCLTVIEANGLGPDHTFGASVAQIERPRIRVMARAARDDYPAARTLAVSARAALGAVSGQSLEGVSIVQILATSDIYPVARDGEDRPVIGCDYTVWLAS